MNVPDIMRAGLVLLLLSAATAGCGSPRQETADGRMVIRDARARPASQSMMGGAYLTIVNGTSRSDTLISVDTDAAATAEVHETYRTPDGLSGMRPAGDLPVGAGARLELSPGGRHIMLMKLKHDLAAGDTVSVTLHFSHHPPLSVAVPVTMRP